MSVTRVATNSQTELFLSQIMQANNALSKTQAQVASGKVASDYAGLGDKTAILESARSAQGRNDAYTEATKLAVNQADLQNTQLTSLSDLANQLRQVVTQAVGSNDGSTLMTQVQTLYDQVVQILNSKDANGNYLYGGDKDNTPPVTATDLSALSALPNAAAAFVNGNVTRSVRTADGETVNFGMLASDVGAQLLQVFKDVADFNIGPNGNFGKQLTQTQSDFLTQTIQSSTAASQNVNQAAAANGFVYSRLKDASDQQTALNTLYTGFVSDLEDTDMGQAVMKLNQNQVALQAALQVTSQLNQISLLNYLPVSGH